MSDLYSYLIIDTYYPRFLSFLYSQFPELAEKKYIDQRGVIMNQCFGTSDSYSRNLMKLGCEAEEIIPNNTILQQRWALEHGVKTERSLISRMTGKIPKIKYLFPDMDESLVILREQIKKIRPDIIYMQDLSFCPPSFLADMKKYVRLIVGQIACPLPPIDHLKPYDLILTSFPHYVNRFREMGIQSEYLRIAFSPSVMEKVPQQERKYNCTFVGGISPSHKQGTELLEDLARKVKMDFWGYGSETLEKSSPIISRHHGEVWGLDMYKALLGSKITINRHIDVAENYANNMRLYEATGCGALLMTDHKDNMKELFNVGSEVVTYENRAELADLIQYYMHNEKEREEIARGGQKRTLTEHTYYNRMVELVGIINKYI